MLIVGNKVGRDRSRSSVLSAPSKLSPTGAEEFSDDVAYRRSWWQGKDDSLPRQLKCFNSKHMYDTTVSSRAKQLQVYVPWRFDVYSSL